MANNNFAQLASQALDGGFTIDASGDAPTTGYVVSTRPDTERRITYKMDHPGIEGYVAQDIEDYVWEHRQALVDGYYLGAWRDGDAIVLDLVSVVHTRTGALWLAEHHKQTAIYDLRTRQVINTAEALRDLRGRQLDDDPNPDSED